MPTDNKHRLWGFGTPRLRKNMTDPNAFAADFYAVNGTSVLRSLEQERIGEKFEMIREQSPIDRIRLVLTSLHHTICAHLREKAAELGIVLVFAGRIAESQTNRTSLGKTQT